MFDPLTGVLTFLLTEAIKKLVVFLGGFGFNLEINGWLSLFVASVVAALVVFANLQAGKLPDRVETLIPILIKVLLTLLEAIGIHSVVKRFAR